MEKLKEIAKEEGVDFIRIAPIWQKTQGNIEIFKKLSFREAPIFIHPEVTWELDIRPSEEELLKGMRKTTRYLIKRAEKDGVEIEKCSMSNVQYLNYLDIFCEMYRDLAQRQHFVPFPDQYLKKEFEIFGKDNQTLLFLGKYREEILAGAIIIFWQNIAFYHQGASSQKYSKIPASYLLQWEAIKEAKKRGCQIYNFWGIAPPGSKPSHRFAGVTLFKMGFGGKMREFVKTQDLPLSWKYWLNFGVESIRRKMRHLG